jgi:ABC-type transport system involved in cytochrome c biogenesis permease component
MNWWTTLAVLAVSAVIGALMGRSDGRTWWGALLGLLLGPLGLFLLWIGRDWRRRESA